MSTPTFLASSRAAALRLGASLTARIPWSVQFSDKMNVGMGLLPAVTAHHFKPATRRADLRVWPGRKKRGASPEEFDARRRHARCRFLSSAGISAHPAVLAAACKRLDLSLLAEQRLGAAVRPRRHLPAAQLDRAAGS